MSDEKIHIRYNDAWFTVYRRSGEKEFNSYKLTESSIQGKFNPLVPVSDLVDIDFIVEGFDFSYAFLKAVGVETPTSKGTWVKREPSEYVELESTIPKGFTEYMAQTRWLNAWGEATPNVAKPEGRWPSPDISISHLLIAKIRVKRSDCGKCLLHREDVAKFWSMSGTTN
jgi:hypothetical protein